MMTDQRESNPRQRSNCAQHLLVSGVVQGVGFRAYVMRIAARYRLEGWVRNRRDGRVEAVLAGPPSDLERAIEEIATGPAGSRVDSVDRRPADRVEVEAATLPPQQLHTL